MDSLLWKDNLPMSPHFIIIIFFLVATTFVSVAKTASNISKESLSDMAITAQKIASEYHEMGWFSGSLLMAKDGKIFFNASYGFEDKNKKTKNAINTKFNLGSIMKNFTKVLVLQQIESEKLSLNDTLDMFDFGFPKGLSSNVTVEHLLNHTSGFGDIFTAQYRENPLAFDTLEKKLQLLKKKPLLFEPGTGHSYSNYGYIVLGAILEKVTNQPFERLLTKNIFERIDLKNTSFKVDSSAKHQSTRYTYLYDGSLKEVGVTEHPSPDGGIESTVKDVQEFYRELFYGSILLNRSSQTVSQAFAMTGEHWGTYGGGLGVSAAVDVNLVDGIEIVVLANTDNLVAEFISTRIQSFIKTGTYQEITPLEINYAYNLYKEKGKDSFYRDFKGKYTQSGYSKFIGRTINELGMQLLTTESWKEAFDIFNYLVAIFPDAAQAYDSLAFAHLSKGEPNTAHKMFQKALDIKSDFNSDYVSNNYRQAAR
ncbi:MAG: CubicO group peptidase (beta-lactamase class C family) [Paraglaciecola sp.]|jgi:CubicO group peptidase (beta-lactamase class C family)